MWEVVGFKFRDSNDRRYYDLYLQRECDSGVGLMCAHLNYSAAYISYVPQLGDRVMYSTREYNGRTLVSEIVKY